MRKPDEFDWINKKLGRELIDPNQSHSVIAFMFIWGMFEGLKCDHNANVPAFEKLIGELQKKGRMDITKFQNELTYFRNRYLENGKTNHNFENLKFRPNDKKELVIKVLKNEEINPTRVLLVLLIIVYRLRNNLFHGHKILGRLYTQSDNFEIANEILKKLI